MRVESSEGRVERWLIEPFDHAGWRGVVRRIILGGTVALLTWGSFCTALGGFVGRMSGRETLLAVAINEFLARVHGCRGDVAIESLPGTGTTVRGSVPVDRT